MEDDGIGMDPDDVWLRPARRATDAGGAAGIGLANVDERLRQVYGDEYGLAVETGLGRRDEGHRARPEVPARGDGVLNP